MIALSWYLLKVIICSGILCGYYFLALRNKAFHRWNRFYILAAILISLLAPIIKINIFQNDADKGTVVQVLQTISYGDEAVIEYSRSNGFQLTIQNVIEVSYLLISIVFLFIFFISLYKIVRLKKNYPETKIEDISFINTNAKGTPFSFFKSVFWNNAIDLHSKPGQQIFNHEIAHIKENHSYDKIFMNIVLIFFWINPFFWLMRKELYMIHEFIADKEAMEDNDISAFAEMILQTVYPGQKFSFTNNFFYSPIKRRIMMLAKNKSPKASYISRLLVLPIAAIVFFAFTLKVKNNNTNLYSGKTITVIIDAGHGGQDNGAISADGIKEKDITLSIAKKIAALNSNDHIKILLSRDNDQTIPVKDRVVFAENNKADLFVSIHVNAAVNEQLNGFSVLIDKNSNEKDQLFGSALINELKKSYKTADKIGERDHGVWVLDQNICPAALVQCGFLSNPDDAAFISNSADQEKVAENILDAINNYTSSEESSGGKSAALVNNTASSMSVIRDTIPSSLNNDKKIKGFTFNDSKNEVYVRYADGSEETINEQEALKRGIILPPPPNALIFINGKKSSKDEMKKIPSSNIQSINVLKGETAIKKYGEKGKDGVIEITTISENIFAAKNDTSDFAKIPKGTLFFVDGKEHPKDKLENIQPHTIESITILKGEDAIKKYGNKGKDGVIEITTKKNSMMSSGKDTVPDKVFTKVEVEASFPGGQKAWQKYIVKKIQAGLDSFTKADYGTCLLKFIVNTDGTISNVEATTMKGTHLANISMEAIKDGPKWIPASQNGKVVAAYRLQPITLTNPDAHPKKNENTSAKIQDHPSFPGGQSAWLKYISRIIQKNGNELIAHENNQGICKVRFIVNKDGRVTDVQAITKEGTQLAEVAMNAIKQGPRWNPGTQDGNAINSYVIQPVGFSLSDEIPAKGEYLIKIKSEN